MPQLDDERAAEVADWLSYAASDLSVACGPRADGARPAVYAFHAQQAAEKALKAVLIACEIEPSRTHNIREIITRIQGGGSTCARPTVEPDALAVAACYPPRAAEDSW